MLFRSKWKAENVKNHHEHGHHHSGDVEALGGAFLLNFIFTLIEIAGGLWTNSVSILADALHDAGDSLALLLAWYLQKASGKERDQRFSYGYGRLSLLAALINGVVLLAGSIVVIVHVIPRLFEPDRKSTRLNSSHALISYAVFCLKKKKKNK